MAQIPSVSVYVGNLDAVVDERALFEHFKEIGPIVSVRVCLDAQTQRSLRYGYVNFQNTNDAESAIEKLNLTKLSAEYIHVNHVERDPTKRRAGKSNLVIKNLPENIEVPTLKELFSKFGLITSIKLPQSKETGKTVGFGYVMFDTIESAVNATDEVNGLELEGKTLKVIPYEHDFQEKKRRQFTNLYIRGLRENVSEEQLSAELEKYGNPTSVAVMPDKYAESSAKGFAFAAFETHEGAVAAIEGLNEKITPSLCDANFPLQVARFKTRNERYKDAESRKQARRLEFSKYPNLYVKNFSDDVDSEKLKAIFDRFGETVSVRVMIDSKTGLSRMFGFVSFKEGAAADRSIAELNGSTIFSNRPLYVARAVKKDARQRQLEEEVRNSSLMNNMHTRFPAHHHNQMMAPNMMYNRAPNHNQMGLMMNHQHQQHHQRPHNPQRPQRTVYPPQPQHQHMHHNQQHMAQMHHQPQPRMHVPPPQTKSLASILASIPPEQQHNMLGERLYSHISVRHPNEAAKVTGMLLEMEMSEILNLLEDVDLLEKKIEEALGVLINHQTIG